MGHVLNPNRVRLALFFRSGNPRFMAAIEVITSQEREVKMRKITGEPYTILIRIWNETVSNLTLMALGELGPSTIVGSAAFNLFVIIACCIFVIPSGQVRRIQHEYVFWVTVVWSTFAYMWLYLILCVFSPNEVEVWEGLLTFIFFPLTVSSAYVADSYPKLFGRRLPENPNLFFARHHSTRRNSMKEKTIATAENGNDDPRMLITSKLDKDVISYEEQRREYVEIFKKIRAELPDVPLEESEKLALERAVSKQKKSRAFYRIQATRQLTGQGDITKTMLKKKAQELIEPRTQKQDVVVVEFDPDYYVCLENVKKVKVKVRCDRGSTDPNSTVTVHYRQEIKIAIVDNGVYEDDEQFLVRLSQVRAYSPSKSAPIPVCLGAASTATVLIIDDDHAGAFGFASEKFKVAESAGEYVATVLRTRGARGEVLIPYKTVDGLAIAGKDYEHREGVVRFNDEQIKAEIRIPIINDDDYEKSEDFYIELAEPIWSNDSRKTEEGNGGRPVLSLHRCKVVITEDKEFKNFVNRMLANANASIMVGTSSWKQQFNEAITIEGGWLCFLVAIIMIGIITAIIGDLASHFGCTVGMKDTVTAITLVAMGTSVPDMFASRTAAVQDKWADSSIGNVTGSNAVNVFLGIGISWAIAACAHAWNGTKFIVNAGSLAFSVTMFIIGSIVCIAVLQFRRHNKSISGELGGPTRIKYISSMIFLFVWLSYIILSTLEAHCIISGF
uniref:Sodium/calcium exchanger 1 n=1 Tax=Angiostrongylus cantonensis TaxID=6313 RepID=A0A158P9X3_ANGCA